jgi:hypothetical protein
MKLSLERVQKDPDVTIGSLSVDGEWECWTCEDAVRPLGVKLAGQTAIPVGMYQIEITYSPRFQRDLPLLIGVPNFSGVRIHPGNTAADTEGCILVGHDRYAKSIGHSRIAFEQLFAKIRVAAIKRAPILLEIV